MPMRTCSGSPLTGAALTAAATARPARTARSASVSRASRPAEIDQHAVTDVTGDEAVKLLDGGGDARLVGADDLPQILGIKPRRQGGGADEIAEHHAERAAFGLRGRGRFRASDQPGVQNIPTSLDRGRRRLTESGNRIKQHAAVADQRDAKVLEVLGGQLRQHPDVDPVVAEGRLVLLKSQLSQKVTDIHGHTTRTMAQGDWALLARSVQLP